MKNFKLNTPDFTNQIKETIDGGVKNYTWKQETVVVRFWANDKTDLTNGFYVLVSVSKVGAMAPPKVYPAFVKDLTLSTTTCTHTNDDQPCETGWTDFKHFKISINGYRIPDPSIIDDIKNNILVNGKKWDDPSVAITGTNDTFEISKDIVKNENNLQDVIHQGEVKVKSFDGKITGLHPYLKDEIHYHAHAGMFRSNMEELLVSSKGSNAITRPSNINGRWYKCLGLVNLEHNTSTNSNIVWNNTTKTATLKAGIYQYKYKAHFYDMGGGELYVKANISGTENTDYYLYNFDIIDGQFRGQPSAGTNEVFTISGFIKVENPVSIAQQIYIPTATQRSSGFGHGQAIAKTTRQNELRITKLDSGVEIDNVTPST